MSYDGTEFELLSEHSLTNRASNHSFGIHFQKISLELLSILQETRILSEFWCFIWFKAKV
jgi:hypothetical protein